MPSLDDLHLDLRGWEPERQDESEVVWSNDAGDILGKYFYDLPPDIGVSLEQLDAVRAFYREVVAGAGGAIVQVDVSPVASVSAVETIFKFPQEPTGMTYIGSLTFAFAEFSFVVKAQCAEHGLTGMREAAVFALLNPEVDAATGEAVGWMQDPCDPSFSAAVLRNRPEAPEWDDKFPEHPLSRCRRYLGAVRPGIRFSDAVKAAPPFTGPAATKKRGWWPFGARREGQMGG